MTVHNKSFKSPQQHTNVCHLLFLLPFVSQTTAVLQFVNHISPSVGQDTTPVPVSVTDAALSSS
jgi:hypothetical protein